MEKAFRDSTVSMTKGLAIILMVLVHARFWIFGENFINMFHMPLFFIMSGYCFKLTYLDNTWIYVKKRLKCAYWPYIKWSIVFLLLHNLFFRLNIYNAEFGFRGVVSELYSSHDVMRRLFFLCTTMTGEEQLLGGYWFLHTYFVASLLSYFALKICKSINCPIIIGGGILLIITVLSAYFGFSLSYYVGTKELLASFFIIVGYLYKYSSLKLEEHPLPIMPLSFTAVFLGVFWGRSNMLSLSWQTIVPYSFSAIAGSLLALTFCNIASNMIFVKRILVYIGDRTLDVLIWHFLGFKIVTFLIILLYAMPIERLAEFPVIEEFSYRGWFVAYLLIGVIFSLFMKYVINITSQYTQKFFLLIRNSKDEKYIVG